MFDGSIVVDIVGAVVYDESFGYANIDFRVPHNRFTRFRLASVSKALTDAAVSLRVLQNCLWISRPVRRRLILTVATPYWPRLASTM